MISFLGNLALWFSLFFIIIQFLIPFKKNQDLILKINKISVNSLLLCSLISFFSLMYAYIVSDFSLVNVFQNSHTTKPLLYKIAGVWGNHEGSMLLWILILSIINYFIFKLYNKKNVSFISKTLQIQSVINCGFVLFILFTSNPFKKMIQPASDGLGFNPILQDPALAIHPPLLYVGYVGFSAAFSFSVATMSLEKKENASWHKYMKPFVAVAWTFLTVGIALGSIWAYYELGWGGWWFWDPVENAALMPWLIGTALFHSLITVEKKRSLQNWVLLLSILSFILSVIGTFLVRSGILTSVHTFALDPDRGIYILTFVSLLGGYSLILFSIKSKNFFSEQYFSFFSREGAILTNNVFMIIVCASIFFGTTYPLFVEIFTNKRISVGEPYFNSTIIPILIPAILVMGIGPILSWNKIDIKQNFYKTIPSIMLTIIIVVTFFFIYKSYNLYGFIGISLSSWIISNIIISIIQRIKKQNNKINFKNNISNHSNSMIIAHLGVGLMILGITGSSIWQKEKIVRMKISDNLIINNYNIIFKEMKNLMGHNYISEQGNFWLYNKNKKFITILKPENRYYPITNNFTTEVSIHTNLLRDLYIVLGDEDVNNKWVVRVYYNPLVIWIWIGAFVIFIGGILTIKNNLSFLNRLNL